MEDTTKKLDELPPVAESGSARRAGVRKHAYPPIYNRGQYTDADNVTHAADAIFYVKQPSE